jgi:DNA-binding XRE family transcriptional regulator
MDHRHLDVPPETPPEQLGLTALDDLLERGDLEDWEPLARAVAADPHGRLAERVLHLCRMNPQYGTSALWQAYIRTLREAAHDPADLTGLRERRGVTQVQMATRLGLGQPRISRIERANDPRIGTLSRYVEAVGGRLHLVVHFADGDAPVALAVPPGGGASAAPLR